MAARICSNSAMAAARRSSGVTSLVCVGFTQVVTPQTDSTATLVGVNSTSRFGMLTARLM